MTAVVCNVGGCGLSIEAHCRNQPNKSKLAQYKQLLSLLLTNRLKQFVLVAEAIHR